MRERPFFVDLQISKATWASKGSPVSCGKRPSRVALLFGIPLGVDDAADA